ncbi:hypothetical protein GALMADRAFT_895032 [Galerina marginata CBS 339.88]|uniref:Uncharacterized protein n=1 Tax=Galerina marginata (strain CBS 339.88) TaxID=685588 RepID=A0A067SRE5_GALM3|nr:hypothetical protein GALMADRAFT_895032 [Galerina marginata CBS 339.88]
MPPHSRHLSLFISFVGIYILFYNRLFFQYPLIEYQLDSVPVVSFTLLVVCAIVIVVLHHPSCFVRLPFASFLRGSNGPLAVNPSYKQAIGCRIYSTFSSRLRSLLVDSTSSTYYKYTPLISLPASAFAHNCILDRHALFSCILCPR